MEQLEKTRRLLRLKGVETVEDPLDPVVPATVLQQFRTRNAVKLNAATFDDLQLTWNPDGTLNTMMAYQRGDVLYELQFLWNADGTLSEIRRVLNGA